MNPQQYASLRDLYKVSEDLLEIQEDAVAEIVTTMGIESEEGMQRNSIT